MLYRQPAGTRNYILSGWVKNENRGLGELRMVTQAGADFAPAVFVSSTTTSNPGWDHITTTTNQLVNINFKFRLTHTGGDFWSKIMTNAIGSGGRDYGYNYGYNGGTGTGTLGAYKGFLYEAMTDPGASSYAVYYDGAIWNTAQTSGLGAETPNYIYNMAPGMKAEYNGMIYAFRNPGLAGNVYALKCFNGSNWSTVNSLAFYQGTALEQSSSVNCYAVFQGNLYMGGWWKGTPEQAIWQYDGTNVNRVYYVAGGGTRVTDLCVYGTRIYALTNWIPGSQVIASVDGLNWVPDANFTLLCVGTFAAGSWATKMVSYNGKLYVGVNGVYPGFMSRLFVYDGVSWSAPAAAVLSEDANITALYVDNGILYIGTSGQDGGRIYTWNGAAINPSYTLFGSSFFKTINSIISYNSLLLANYNQWNPGPVGETGILQWGGYTLFDDVSLSPAQVVFSSSTAVSTDTTYEYYTNYGTSETDLNKYRKYRLRYDRPNRKLYRERWTGPNPTDYALDGPDPLCANVVNLTIINRNQESFLVRLVLEKPVGEGKTKLYRVENECAPRVP